MNEMGAVIVVLLLGGILLVIQLLHQRVHTTDGFSHGSGPWPPPDATVREHWRLRVLDDQAAAWSDEEHDSRRG